MVTLRNIIKISVKHEVLNINLLSILHTYNEVEKGLS